MIRQRPQAQQARNKSHPTAAVSTATAMSSSGYNNWNSNEDGDHIAITIAPTSASPSAPGTGAGTASTAPAMTSATMNAFTLQRHTNSYNDNYEVTMAMSSFPSHFIAPTPRPPRMIPDKDYRHYISRTSKSNNKGSCCTSHDAAKACSYISFVGMVFLFWIHFMMERQPIFIKGIVPKNIAYPSPDYKHQLLPASESALYAAWAYMVTFCSCLIYTYKNHQRQYYRDIPDTDSSTLPVFHTTTFNDNCQPFLKMSVQRIQRVFYSITTANNRTPRKRRGVWNKDM